MPDFIERRRGDRRIHHRRTHGDNRRSSGRAYQVPRRMREDRRHNDGRRVTNGHA